MQLVEDSGDMERGIAWKPKVEISPNCPRCGSSNTKFCYYNNYSLTQPRYFCKGCRRYWTKGGSLRNVPVGGGCRRNRRVNNKTMRQSNNIIDAAIPSKNLSYDPRKSSSSTSSSAVSDAPNIDLALVYANFLNQKPDSKPGLEKPEMQAVFDWSIPTAEISPSLSLPEELSFNGCLNLSELSSIKSHFNQMYFCEFNCMQNLREDRTDTINFELPPLPCEETVSHDTMMWSNSHEMMLNHDLQATQPPGFEDEAYEEVLFGNWSQFDLPKDSSFSKP